MRIPSAIAFAVVAGLMAMPGLASGQERATEANCTDGEDNDGDMVYDCADADCFTNAACKPDGAPEVTDARCGDWIDNDNDGQTDCDDSDCQIPSISVCRGSWQDPKPTGSAGFSSTGSSGGSSVPGDLVLQEGMTVEDLIGRGGDIDGERNDFVCADGIDNDGDGRTDCQDFGCQFDRTVTVCQGSPDFRFSVVARAEQFMTLKDTAEEAFDEDLEYPVLDARFTRIQLRSFGQIPFVEDSFYLLSMRVERTPRLTFLLFQLPVGNRGHYLNINSGTGGLSVALARSAHKRLFLDPPFYLYNAFEQGNGVAVELGGPIDSVGKLQFRSFVAGGSGRFAGNVGGGILTGEDENFNYSLGAQVQYNLLGYYSRWDSPLLYTPAATTLAAAVGVKYDQRSNERYPAIDTNIVFRHQRIIAIAELYAKYQLDWDTIQYAYNIQFGYLVIPKKLLVAADFGEFIAQEPDDDDPDAATFELPQQETQARLAAHYYLWRNVLVASLVFSEQCLDPEPGGAAATASSPLCADGDEVNREIRLAATYRF
ncbi:MAG: hypothetical protein AAGC55_00220 [Myxococcota bacterium]